VAVFARGCVDTADLSLIEGDAGEARFEVQRDQLTDLYAGGLTIAVVGSQGVLATGDG